MNPPEYTTLAAARQSTEPAIHLKLNLPKPAKQLEEAFALPNLMRLTLNVANGFGDIPESLLRASKLHFLRIEDLEKYKVPVEWPEIFTQLSQIEYLYVSSCKNLVFGNQSWGAMHSLREFYAYASGNSFPRGLLDLPDLESLHLSSCQYPEIPTEIGHRLKNLRKLMLNVFHQNKVPYPESIAAIESLESLRLDGQAIPDWLGNGNPQLKSLALTMNERQTSLPEAIFGLHQLESLRVYHVGISSLSPLIGKLTALKSLDLTGNLLEHLPEELAQLIHLTSVNISRNQFKHIPGVLARIPLLKDLELKIQATHDSAITAFERFRAWLQTRHVFYHTPKQAHKDYFADLWDNQQSVVAEEENERTKIERMMLYNAVGCKIAPLNQNALTRLTVYSPDRYRPLAAGDVLLLGCKTGLPKTALRTKLKDLGIDLVNEADERLTHYVVGTDSEDIYPQFKGTESTRYCLMSEGQLMDFLDSAKPDFLVKDSQKGEDAKLVERVNLLLYSQARDNVSMALQLLKSGGVPEQCKTGLFLCYKTLPDAKVREDARKLLLLAASEELKAAMKKRVDMMDFRGYRDFSNKMAAFSHTEIDTGMMAMAYFRHHRNLKAMPFLLQQKRPEITLEVLKMMTKEDGELSLSLGYHDLDFVPPEIVQVPGLRKLGLWVSRSPENLATLFPVGLDQLQDLQELEMQYGYHRIDELPAHFISALQQLPHLKKLTLKTRIPNQFGPQLQACLPGLEVVT